MYVFSMRATPQTLPTPTQLRAPPVGNIRLHDHTWDEVCAKMYLANMRNFVVYLHEETFTMFHHFEYIGDDFEVLTSALPTHLSHAPVGDATLLAC